MQTRLFRALIPAWVCVVPLVWAQNVGVWYADPPGGWQYVFHGNAAAAGSGGFTALDGTWSHDNGSDEWDGSALGAAEGRPGGISVLTEGLTTFIRIQDTGDPRDHGYGDPGSNRKIYLAHNLATEGISVTDTFLDTGVTLTFRARISTTGLLDPQYPDTASNGENRTVPGGTAWPAAGTGLLGHDGGKGNFTIRQENGDRQVSFSLTLSTDLRSDGTTAFGTTGLTMNSRNGTSPSGAVDPWENEGTINVLPMASLTDDFHEFWITIRADTSGGGTHRVEVYVDGATTPQVFHVTAGDGNDSQYNGINFIAMGAGATPQQAALDVDFFAYKVGLYVPELAGDPTAPMGFTLQPVSVTTNEGVLVSFSVVATGAPPRNLQWQRSDGTGGFTNIPGAVWPTLVIGPVIPPDDGAVFRCVAQNSFSTAISDEAVLRVIADTTPPAIVRVSGDGSGQHVWIEFSEPVNPDQATEIINYSFDPFLNTFSATVDPRNGARVLIVTDPQPPGQVYRLTLLDGIDDLAYTPNRLPAGTEATFTAWAPSRGFLCGQHFWGIAGSAVSDLTSHAKYPMWWDSQFHVNSAQTVQTAPNLDNYGGRLLGWIIPPVGGSYIFYIRGDDGTELRLSPTEDPAGLVTIAAQASANQPFTAGASAPQLLQAGQRYAIEALWKEGSGSDYVQVAWQTPLSPDITIIGPEALEALADPSAAAVSILRDPQSAGVFANRPATLTVEIAFSPTNAPTVFFWQRGDGAGGFSTVAATTTNTFTTPILRYPDDDQSTWRVIVAVPGAAQTSAVATLTVVEDLVGPKLVSAVRAACDIDKLTVVFDELVDPASAQDFVNYTIINLSEQIGAPARFDLPPSLGPDGKTVTLWSVDPITNGALYKVVAQMQDLAGNSAQSEMVVRLIGAFEPYGPQNLIVMEAENYDAMVPRVWEGVLRFWELTTGRAGYSGAGAMRALPNTEGNRPSTAADCTSLDFCVNFPTAGTWYLWVRGAAESGADNSCHAGLDGGIPPSANNLQPQFVVGATGWSWNGVINDNTRSYLDVPSAGLHTVHIYMREDGFYCDKLLLTTDPNYDPSTVNGGFGPDESPRQLTTPPLRLEIGRDGTDVVISWAMSAAVLQQADQITGPWTDVAGATSPYRLQPTAAQKFYRLVLR